MINTKQHNHRYTTSFHVAQHASHSSSLAKTENAEQLPEWNLSDLYNSIDDPKVKADFDYLAQETVSFEKKYKGCLASLLNDDNLFDFAEAIKKYEKLDEIAGKLISFAGLLYFSNSTDQKVAKFYGDMQANLTNAATSLLFFSLEINRLDESILNKAINNNKTLSYYAPWLLDLRKDLPHQLEDKIEQLFLEKSITGASAWNRLFDETITSLEFEINGEKIAIEATLNMLQDNDETTRKNAANALAKTLSKNSRVFTLIVNTLAKDKEISDRWHNFNDIADSRHLANRVEREVVDALSSSVEAAYPRISHRYYAMKAKWLGKEKLEPWDRNAPLPDTDQQSISFEDARKIIIDAYNGFSPEMANLAQKFFDNNWIDAAIRPGKSPGAFAHPTVPSAHPYVLINYMGRPRDVMTLAHELGHGVHQILAGEQGALMAPTPLTLAETASVFGEMLTFRALLEKTTNKQQRKIMLAQKVEDMINTVVRQIAFYQFERKVHTARREGELTSQDLNAMWSEIQKASLGPAFNYSEDYTCFWSYIPHFIHSPFYVYAYAFGDCLVNSLYAVFQASEEGFQDKYFDLLRAGGTKHHKELLAPFNLDASDPEFWANGLKMIEGLIDELENLDRDE